MTLKVRARGTWLTPKPGVVGATTGLTMLAAGAPTPGTTVTKLVMTSSVAGDGQVTISWDTTIGTDGLNVTGVRTGRNGVDAVGSGPWSTDDPLDGTRIFTKLVNGTAYQFFVQLLVDGALYGNALTVSLTPVGSGTTTPPPPPPGGSTPAPAHPSALAKVASLGMPPTGRRWWSGGRGDGISPLPSTADIGGFARFRGAPVDATSTWVDTADGANWSVFGITNTTPNDVYGQFDRDFSGLLDLAIGGPANYAAAAGGSLDAKVRTMFTNVRRNRINPSTNKPYPTIIRSCHEQNGTWYPWTVSPGEEADFLRYNRRIRAIMDETFPEAAFAICFNGDQNSGASCAAMWDSNVWDLCGVDYYNQYPYIGTASASSSWEPGKFTSWEDGAFRGTADQPRGVERWRQFAEKRGVPLYLPEWGNVADKGTEPYFMNQFLPWVRQHAGSGPGQVFMESYFNIWQGYNSVFQIYATPGAGGAMNQPQVATAYANFFKSNG